VSNAQSILLIEDDADVGDALAEVLADEGFVIARANHGLEALAYLRRHDKPAVILLDLMMPVMDGFAFRAEQIRQELALDVPIFVITAGAINDRVKALNVSQRFSKPIDLGLLFEALDRVMKKPQRPIESEGISP
jgi:CheY-like chemotaxis protein